MPRGALLVPVFLFLFALASPQQAAAGEEDHFSNWCSSLTPGLCQSYSGFDSEQVQSWIDSFLDHLHGQYQIDWSRLDWGSWYDRPPRDITQPTSVPEPSTWPMIVPGLLVIGFLARRRRDDRLA